MRDEKEEEMKRYEPARAKKRRERKRERERERKFCPTKILITDTTRHH